MAREQIADVLAHSLTSNHAVRKTVELIATTGPAPEDFDGLFAPLEGDPHGALDGVHESAQGVGRRPSRGCARISLR